MLYYYAALASFMSTTARRARSRLHQAGRTNDSGLTTLELLVLGVGLFAVATAAVVFYKNVVQNTESGIPGGGK